MLDNFFTSSESIIRQETRSLQPDHSINHSKYNNVIVHTLVMGFTTGGQMNEVFRQATVGYMKPDYINVDTYMPSCKDL